MGGGLYLTSPRGYNIPERVRPRDGGQGGRIIHRRMASLRVQFRRRKMTMGVSMFHTSVQCTLHVSQINEGIYVDGATRTATAKVTPFTSQHASELNARLIQHRGGRRNPPSPNVSCAFRPWPLLAGAHTLAHPRIPEDALITNRAPPTSLAPDYKCIRFPIRTAPASFIVCEPVPFAQVPCVQALVYPAPHCCPTICFPESQLNVVRFR